MGVTVKMGQGVLIYPDNNGEVRHPRAVSLQDHFSPGDSHMPQQSFVQPTSQPRPIRVGLLGYGRAGQAVASVLMRDPALDLRWVLRRDPAAATTLPGSDIPVCACPPEAFEAWLVEHPVEVLIDFSHAAALPLYADAVRRLRVAVVSAVSSYPLETLAQAQVLGEHVPVMCSPNITLGINFLMLAAKLLRHIAPHADVEVVEQHFRDKPEVSGTARKIAQMLMLDDSHITALRLGGIVGHHEVIFGFPHQTVRLAHDSIRREAFGSGAAFAAKELVRSVPGFYSFEDVLWRQMQECLPTPPVPSQVAGPTDHDALKGGSAVRCAKCASASST